MSRQSMAVAEIHQRRCGVDGDVNLGASAIAPIAVAVNVNVNVRERGCVTTPSRI